MPGGARLLAAWPFWALAFGVALCAFAHSGARRGHRRFALALWLGAGATHAGWWLLHLPLAARHPEWAAGAGGACVLFLPLGVLALAPWREALAALPPALFAARLGCLAAGCCYPTVAGAIPELAGCLALHAAVRRRPREACVLVLSGLGALRLVVLPLRAPSPLEPWIDPAWVAGAWLPAGLALRRRIGSAGRARRLRTGDALRRLDPLLRALARMLAVWGLFPLAGWLLADAAKALALASGAALLVLRPPRPATVRRPRPSAALRCGRSAAATAPACAALGVGWLAGRALGPASAAPPALPALLAQVALTPVVEERLYRGHLLRALRGLWGGPAAGLASSVLFALAHGGDPRVVPAAFAGGLLCAALVLRTGSLAAAVGLHAGWNLAVLR